MRDALSRLERYEKEDGMPKGVRLSEEQRRKIYHAYAMNESVEDIADLYGISQGHVRKIIRDQRKARDSEMAAREKVVAGDKRNGRLTSTTDPHRYEGTCVIDGRAKSKTFVTVNAKKAEEMWRKWCDDLHAEQEFMDMVERKEPEAVCGAPSDPMEEIHPIAPVEPAPIPEVAVRPWKEVAEERQSEIDALNKKVSDLEAKVAEYESGEWMRIDAVNRALDGADHVIASTELPDPKLERWFNDNGSFAVVWRDKPLYVIWARGDQPRLFGAYQSIDDALRRVDELNDVAAFLGNDRPLFEVEEVEWR